MHKSSFIATFMISFVLVACQTVWGNEQSSNPSYTVYYDYSEEFSATEAVYTFADGNIQKLMENQNILMINGKFVGNASIKIVNNYSLAPLKIINDAFGGTTQWDAASQKITITYNGETTIMYIGKQEATIGGKSLILSTAPIIINGTTYVPIKNMGEIFHAEVQYKKNMLSNLANIITLDNEPFNNQFFSTEDAAQYVQREFLSAVNHFIVQKNTYLQHGESDDVLADILYYMPQMKPKMIDSFSRYYVIQCSYKTTWPTSHLSEENVIFWLDKTNRKIYWMNNGGLKEFNANSLEDIYLEFFTG